MQVKIEMENCEQCPFAQVSKVYTRDSWENVRKVHCTKLNKDVHEYLDWYDKSPIPNECPIKC
ncbi:hypothetical protein CN434_25495 [Bacillus thuringiensis]|uniref:Uncharacterized protein n=1 Tax=Bacillus thuringiensis TaxID=1428 RepID=A0A9X7ATK9_BACTU|nr:hypothetical protein CN434_25495 [Bacillus thuringiensis]PFT50808.1 hypothetical protein COK72_02035 [Bacillus thuringiensis]PFY22845.1 hypothetical protein COL44_18355 [Bacillus toyonensis]